MALGNLQGAGRRTLYVSGEESAAQIRLRAERLPGAALDVPVLAETDLDTVLATLDAERPEVCVIDSVQTLHAAELTGAAGLGRPGARGRRPDHAARQGARDRRPARRPRHQGGRAGRPARARAPGRLRAAVRGRARAHLPHAAGAEEPLRLDQRRRRLRDALRAGWSRSPTRRRASSARRRSAPGSAVLAAMEGSRPLLVEVQALVSPSELVPPRRVANGIDRNRLALVLAVLGRHAGVGVGSADVFVNVAGGVRVDEPGADLAVALAVASAAARRRARRRRAPGGVLRRGRADRRAALGRPPGPPAGRGAKFGLQPVIAPRESGARVEAPTLRAGAARRALGVATRAA